MKLATTDPVVRRLIRQLAARVIGPRLDAAWLQPDLEQSLRTAIGDFWTVHKHGRADDPRFDSPEQYTAWMADELGRMAQWGPQVQPDGDERKGPETVCG